MLLIIKIVSKWTPDNFWLGITAFEGLVWKCFDTTVLSTGSQPGKKISEHNNVKKKDVQSVNSPIMMAIIKTKNIIHTPINLNRLKN